MRATHSYGAIFIEKRATHITIEKRATHITGATFVTRNNSPALSFHRPLIHAHGRSSPRSLIAPETSVYPRLSALIRGYQRSITFRSENGDTHVTDAAFD